MRLKQKNIARTKNKKMLNWCWTLNNPDIFYCFDENKDIKFMLTNLLYVSKQDWWLEVTLEETYPFVDSSSTGSRKYLSSPSKQQLEYECLFEFISLFLFIWFCLKWTCLWIYLIFSFVCLTIILSYEWKNMKSPDPFRQQRVVSTYFRKQDQSGQWS